MLAVLWIDEAIFEVRGLEGPSNLGPQTIEWLQRPWRKMSGFEDRMQEQMC